MFKLHHFSRKWE